jgi:hypothetical protein
MGDRVAVLTRNSSLLVAEPSPLSLDPLVDWKLGGKEKYTRGGRNKLLRSDLEVLPPIMSLNFVER